MSLNVFLYIDKSQRFTVYSSSITHNLGKMAKEAGLYQALWRPEEINKTNAVEIVEILEKGLAYLKLNPDYFKTFNNPYGFGMYRHLVRFVSDYLKACKKYPDAVIGLSR
jgi:hypothetical protein